MGISNEVLVDLASIIIGAFMPRIARVVIPGIPHHITQRGNRRQNMFFSDADRNEYLRLVLKYSVQAGLRIIAYCLMTNHVHLIAIPALKNTLAKVFKPVHTQICTIFQPYCWLQWQGLSGSILFLSA
jgi:REP element-mobilizing transposase RayT